MKMKKKIITISREYGSGGRDIGRLLAARLGIPFYDKNMAALSAARSGLSSDFIEQSEERVSGWPDHRAYLSSHDMPLPDRVFFAQSEVIRLLAARGSCVIVGRCADYVLRDMPECTHLFIHAPLEERVRRIVRRTGCTASQAERRILAADKSRATYHDRYARGSWGHASNYHFAIDTSIGTGPAVDIIMHVLAVMEGSAI